MKKNKCSRCRIIKRKNKRRNCFKVYFENRRIFNSIFKYLGYGVGVIFISHILSYHNSKKIAFIKLNDAKDIDVLNYKIKTNNKLGKAISALEHAMRHVIISVKLKKKYDQNYCDYLLNKFNIEVIEDNMHNEGHSVKQYYGPDALMTGIRYTQWFDKNKETCFFYLKNAEQELEFQSKKLKAALSKNAYDSKTYPP